jgi:hypothetical protein
MGLRCSLLGHAYAEPEIERERDDRGDEVVVTVRETKTCERCGAETVVSENTEVRPVEPEPTGDADAAESPSEDPAPETSPGVDDEFEPPASAAEDDAVILDDEVEGPEAPDRQPGEWPAADDTRVEEDSEAAAVAGEEPAEPDTEAGDAEAGDAEVIDAEAESEVDVEDASPTGGWPDPDPASEDEGFDAEPGYGSGDVEMGGLTPQGVADAEAEGETVVGGDDFGTGIESTGRTSPDRTDDVDVDAEFVCPACDYAVPVLNSSLREGDICPECQRGYLSEESPTRN